MSETKTTEEMRELYTDGGFWPSDGFDRWLEHHDAKITAKAEQRIIKLLEELDRHGTTHSEFCAARHAYAAQAIALIKGENK